MSCGMLQLADKKILLVGGGKHAYKKACELLEDKAIITCIDEQFNPLLHELDITLLTSLYHKDFITSQYFMVYAITDDRDLNHQVVLDANEKGIISASYHKDDAAVFKAMKYQQYDALTIALSTSGKYPAFTKTVFDEIEKIYTKRHEERLRYLGIIRDYLLKENIERKYLLEDLLSASMEELRFYSEAIYHHKAVVFVFHGVKQQQMYTAILDFLDALKLDGCGVYFSYIDDDALKQYHYFEEMNRILSLDKICKTLHLLGIQDVVYQPMLFDEGSNYEKMKCILKDERVHALLFNRALLEALLLEFIPTGNNLLVLPPLSSLSLKEMIISLHIPNLYVMSIDEEIPFMECKGELHVTGLFVLIDEDTTKQLFGKSGIYVKLIETDYDAVMHRKIIIEEAVFRNYVSKYFS